MGFRLPACGAPELLLAGHRAPAWSVGSLTLQQPLMRARCQEPSPGPVDQGGQLTEAKPRLGCGLATIQQQGLGDGSLERVTASYPCQTGNPAALGAADTGRSKAANRCVCYGYRAMGSEENAARDMASSHAVPARADRTVPTRPLRLEPGHGPAVLCDPAPGPAHRTASFMAAGRST